VIQGVQGEKKRVAAAFQEEKLVGADFQGPAGR